MRRSRAARGHGDRRRGSAPLSDVQVGTGSVLGRVDLALPDVGAEGAGPDDGNAYAGLAQFVGDGLGPSFERELRGAVSREAWRAVDRGVAGDHDDPSV